MRWRGAMLDGKREVVVGAAQVEGRVEPGVEFRRASQSLAGAGTPGALARVVHDEDRECEATLEVAQVGE